MSSVHPQRGFIVRTVSNIIHALVAAVGRLDKSLSPAVTIQRLRAHKFTVGDSIYLFHIALAAFWTTLMQDPAYPYKLAIPILYTIALCKPVVHPSHRLPSRNTSLPSIRICPNVLPPPSSQAETKHSTAPDTKSCLDQAIYIIAPL
ncbi:hypothetical protein M413DRAFT_25568 [Hebeloma cylindrosporum]|uniref:Uncharacterized protein n=1 Tax=Hebeloma cylindrosporum TaxID=76867 RepID=A0A0C2Y2Q3_HEBCY|nr:hypothetical protein M413DRAFT_25568 [Hebeloma cylindrosporum h7]